MYKKHVINDNENEINRLRPKPRHRYSKYKMCLRVMMVICIKQHQSNI